MEGEVPYQPEKMRQTGSWPLKGPSHRVHEVVVLGAT